MDYKLFQEKIKDSSIDELMNIQQECLLTIRPSLVAISKKVEIDINKSFFLFCMSCVICDNFVSDNEYLLIKKFIKINVSKSEVQDYATELNKDNHLLDFSKELVNLVGQVTKEGKEELIKFAICFLCADGLSEEKNNFLNQLIN